MPGFSRFDELPEDRDERECRDIQDREERSERFAKELRDDLMSMAKATIEVVPMVTECACCGNKYGIRKFRTLELKGYMSSLDGGRLELRKCGASCGNTLSIRVSE